MSAELIAGLVALIGALGGFWRWVANRLDADARRLEALEVERTGRFLALESRLDKRETDWHETLKALARAEAALDLTRTELDKAIKALNRERGRPCRHCGRGSSVITSLDEVTEEIL